MRFLIHLLKTKQIWIYVIKQDMEKAYGSLVWVIVRKYFMDLGFSIKWTNWIMEYITTTILLVHINGKLGSPFKLERGIRQGDPISLYFFIISAEHLGHIIISCQLLRKKVSRFKLLKIVQVSLT